ncbi:TetR/AcrR family transcriptional regulator [Marichromatium bheemlicum]|uniref:TetR/AcrR family transcriptional regulator n=1 Tax=Marichromatium bheemlicum TaxID=365339 RepID=A0ABX1I9G4_9GAMM|nr:TetR/AcrR family transcriptional regulator [Marichromatium bheemlicum]NKN34190.1 TetR/AcrR family transcriptional regulator [Marichromatium bheemlicum]
MPEPQAPKPPLRERVLDAAETVVMRDGAARLTLDAVITEAAVSKGGMLYHFKSKEALLEGLVARTLARDEAEIAALRDTLPADLPNREGRARLTASLAHCPVSPELGIAVIAASAHHRELLTPARAHIASALDALTELESEIPTARLLYLAMAGLYMLDALGISPLEPDAADALRAQARRILDDHGART